MNSIDQGLFRSALCSYLLRDVTREKWRPALLDSPADESVRDMPAQGAHCGHGMNDISHGTQAHDQEPHRASTCKCVLKRVMCRLIFSCQSVRPRRSLEFQRHFPGK